MPTKLIRSLYNITPNEQGGVVTIGNFDGVHLGHQALIGEVVAKARALKVPAIVVTFEPYPAEFFGKSETSPRLTRLREKFTVLAKLGVDAVIILKFNQELANYTASEFVTKIIYQSLRPVQVYVGDDFRFGRQRQGDLVLLQTLGQSMGFEADNIASVLLDNERVSSTRVRKALVAGDHSLAERLLGRPYTMQGRVRHGDKLGRQLGYPTANIHLHRQLSAVQGVYAVLIHGLGSTPLYGAANVGTRPAVDGTRTLLEVHLLDFNQDIYGRYVEVEFCHKLRDEAYYPTLDLLREQIGRDVIATRHYFQTQGML